MKNKERTMKNLLVFTICILALAGCIGEPQNAGDKPATTIENKPNVTATTTPDGSTQDSSLPDASIQDASTQTESVFRTPELGVLVEAPAGTRVATLERPSWSTQAIASAKFVRPNGNEYTVLVYRKGDESLSDWLKSAEIGNTFLTDTTERTLNGKTAYVYSTNDYGLLPDIHVMVVSANLIYNFKFGSGLPQNQEEASRVMRESTRSRDSWFAVPQDMLSFINESNVH